MRVKSRQVIKERAKTGTNYDIFWERLYISPRGSTSKYAACREIHAGIPRKTLIRKRYIPTYVEC